MTIVDLMMIALGIGIFVKMMQYIETQACS